MCAVRRVVSRALDIEVVTPTCEFEAVVTELLCLPGKNLEWQVCPLAGKEGDWSRH
jgi:hypothetical protein